jgi:hypothetical protein
MDTIANLQDAIAALESEQLRLENEILRKRIAIEEIVQCRRPEPEMRKAIRVTTDHVVGMAEPPSVTKMILELLDSGAPSDLRTLQKLCIARYPSKTAKIRRGIWQAARRLIDRGVAITLSPRRKSRKNNGNINGNEIHHENENRMAAVFAADTGPAPR